MTPKRCEDCKVEFTDRIDWKAIRALDNQPDSGRLRLVDGELVPGQAHPARYYYNWDYVCPYCGATQ